MYDQKKYAQEFNQKHYDTISLRVPKGKREEIRAFAEARGLSVNELFKLAMKTAYGFDFEK